MSKAVEVLASGLYIEKLMSGKSHDDQFDTPKFQRVEAPEETKEIFREKLTESLTQEFTSYGGLKAEVCIQYGYYVGTVRGSNRFSAGAKVTNITANLKAIMDQLPKLEDGDSYRVPANTYIWFKLDQEGEFAAETSKPICPWIARAL